MNYKVNICTPIYGVEKYIEKCAVSLFEQTYENIEYIFINDCTKDTSIDILENIIQRYPNRKSSVKIINHTINKGLGETRNTGIDNTSGEFILWVDSDDYIDLDYVEKLVNKQVSTNADIVTSAFIIECPYYEFLQKQNVKDVHETTLNCLSKKDYSNVWGRLIRKSIYIKNNIKVENQVNNSEDYQVIPKLFYNSDRIQVCNETYYRYNCLNMDSYTYHFSESNAVQTWITWKNLLDYFNDKGKEYIEALKYSEAFLITADIMNSAKTLKHKSYFIKCKRKLIEIDPTYIRALPFLKKIALNINSYYILHLYMYIFCHLKHLLKKTQYYILVLRKK